MAATSRLSLSPEELTSFSRRLDTWMRTLTPQEAEFMGQMLADAADAANEDASGYADLAALGADFDVEGHAMGANPIFAAVTTYASGVTRDEAELEDIIELTSGSM